ncbi:MAG: Rpn family recombination-promoting nuclease/putative transposase, partial [Treponema sp.]
ENTAAMLNDKSYKVFYNASAYSKERDKELFALLQYISKKQTGSPFTDEINRLVEQAKRNEAFRSDYLSMNLREYDLRRMGREEGIVIGEKRGMLTGIETTKLANAKNFLAEGLSAEQVARCVKLPIETVRRLQAELPTVQDQQ